MSYYIETLPTNYNYRLSEFIGDYSGVESDYKATFHASILTISLIGGASIAVVLSDACSKFFFYYFFVISILIVILFSVRHLRTLVRSFRSYL